MSSRIDYLSKYLLESDSEKKKKKKKKSRIFDSCESVGSLETTPVVISGARLPTEQTEPIIQTFDESEDQDAPIQVVNASAIIVNKGFRRVDNGQVLTPSELRSKPEETAAELNDAKGPESFIADQNKTIYRDKSGRIINIEEKKAQIKERNARSQEERERLQKCLNTGDFDKLKERDSAKKLADAHEIDPFKVREKHIAHLKQKTQFDDPLLAFNPKDDKPFALTGRPIYKKGVHPCNRFNFSAGYFWDGIDRSNGFEYKLVTKRNESKMASLIEKNSKETYTDYDFD